MTQRNLPPRLGQRLDAASLAQEGARQPTGQGGSVFVAVPNLCPRPGRACLSSPMAGWVEFGGSLRVFFPELGTLLQLLPKP